MNHYYKHSGKFTPLGLLLGLLAGLLISVPASFAYNFAIVNSPEMRLCALCTIAFGVLVGAVTGVALCWGKVRSDLVAGLTGLGVSLFALYVSWVSWILHLFFPAFWVFNPLRLALRPFALWGLITAVNTKGTWSYAGGTPVHGVMLWVIWLCEAALVLASGVMMVLALMNRRPFCEHCEEWCSQRLQLYFEPAITPEEFKARLEAEDLAALSALTPGDKKKANYRVDLHTCGNCHTLNTLTLMQNFLKDRKTLVNKLVLTAEQASVISNLGMAQHAAVGASSPGLSSS